MKKEFNMQSSKEHDDESSKADDIVPGKWISEDKEDADRFD